MVCLETSVRAPRPVRYVINSTPLDLYAVSVMQPTIRPIADHCRATTGRIGRGVSTSTRSAPIALAAIRSGRRRRRHDSSERRREGMKTQRRTGALWDPGDIGSDWFRTFVVMSEA
jgi:hypothetical protein